jgi:hypothetical protein
MAHDPPLYQQSGSYPAQVDRRALLASIWPGGGGAGAKPVAVANLMQVSIPPGWLAVPLVTGQGTAICRWDAAEVVTLAAAPASGNQRWDAVVCQVRDPDLDGGANADFVFAPVTGVPAASNPAIPATPANAALVSLHLITGGQSNLNTATLLDRRPLGRCDVWQNAAQALPNTAFGQIFFDTVAAGAGWNFGAYTCPMAGRYLVTAAVSIDRAVNFASLAVFVTPSKPGRAGSNYNATGLNSRPILSAVIPNLAAGDALSISALVGPAANTVAGQDQTYAGFQWLSP